MTTPTRAGTDVVAAVPAAGDLPLLRALRDAFQPLTEWAPDWARAVLWAVLVLGLVLGAVVLALHVLLPWLGRALPGPVTAALDLAGKALALPEYLATRQYRQRERPVPALAYSYGSALGAVVTTLQQAARRACDAFRLARDVPNWAVVVGLLLGVAAWNQAYCADRDGTCTAPISEWADTVRAATEGSGDDAVPPPGG